MTGNITFGRVWSSYGDGSIKIFKNHVLLKMSCTQKWIQQEPSQFDEHGIFMSTNK